MLFRNRSHFVEYAVKKVLGKKIFKRLLGSKPKEILRWQTLTLRTDEVFKELGKHIKQWPDVVRTVVD